MEIRPINDPININFLKILNQDSTPPLLNVKKVSFVTQDIFKTELLTNQHKDNLEDLLEKACIQGDLLSVQQIFKKKIVITKEKVKSCFFQLIQRDHKTLVEIFINYFKNEPFLDFEFLEVCVLYNRLELLILLVNTGLNPSQSEFSLLTNACRFGRYEIVNYLLKHTKIDPSVSENKPLKIALERGFNPIASLLLKDERVMKLYLKKKIPEQKPLEEKNIANSSANSASFSLIPYFADQQCG